MSVFVEPAPRGPEAACPPATARAAAEEPGGACEREGAELRVLPGGGRAGLPAWLAIPRRRAAGAAPLVLVHGVGRDARGIAAALAGRAAAGGRVVVAPLFEAERWPAYQRMVVRGRADLALIALLDALRAAGLAPDGPVDLAGYSGGAQFAHRFAMLHPGRVARLTAISAGWYTFPDSAPFPFGLGARAGRADDWGPRMAARLEAFLSLPVEICVGAEDRAADEHLRRSRALDAQQGAHRLARARAWREALGAAAAARGLPCRARLHELPGAGHDFAACLAAGALEPLLPLAPEPAGARRHPSFLDRDARS